MTVTVSVPYDTMSTTSRSDQLFKKCCCCFPLRTGCFILGYLNLIFNVFHTLVILTLTTYVGITTHGFDHFDSDQTQLSDQAIDIESDESPILGQVGLLLIVVLCANVAWLLIVIACLVGLHKKRPGPIRVYIGFASARFLLSLAGFIYLVMTSSAGSGWQSSETIVTHSVELGLAAYFILVYYVYAVQLEREMQEEIQISPEAPITDKAFVQPIKTDKQVLIFSKY